MPYSLIVDVCLSFLNIKKTRYVIPMIKNGFIHISISLEIKRLKLTLEFYLRMTHDNE